ncbi:MAG: pilus assembly protein TadG-related protein [Candidatus Limnocylindrales bacterium]
MTTNLRDRQRGQMLVVFTLALVAIIAMVGLVIDGGAAYAQRRGEQNAADLAALAGADALINGQSQAQAIIIARNVAASNSYTDGVNGVTVTVTFPTNLVQVDVQAPHQNYFAGVVGQPTWHVSTTAQAKALNETPDTAYGAAPFILSNLAFTNNQPQKAFTQSGCPTNNADGIAGCVFGDGHHGDYPADTGDFAWTLFGANVNTADVAAYMNEIGYLNGISGCSQETITPVTYTTNDYIGQQNQGNHNGAINQGGACITNVTIAVPITGPPISPATTCNDGSHTNGCFYGWAEFYVSGIFKSGNDSHVDGWFIDTPPSAAGLKTSLSDTSCTPATCPPIGPKIFTLNLVN